MRTRISCLVLLTLPLILLGLGILFLPAILSEKEHQPVSRVKGGTRSLATALARLRADTGATDLACLRSFDNLLANEAPANCILDGYTGINLPHCNSLPRGRAGEVCWGGPYLVADGLIDPWQHDYTVTIDTRTWAITARSAGPDRVFYNADDVTFRQ